MQHSTDLKTQLMPGDNASGVASQLRLRDRAVPGWALPLSVFFSVGIGVCMVVLAVMTVFLQSLAARPGEALLAPLLGGVALVPVLGVLVLEYAHAKAMSGYRYARQRNAVRARAAMAGVVFLILSFLHPLLGLAIPLGTAASFAIAAGFERFARPERPWDFLPAEAVSILSGRDASGLRLASDPGRDTALLRNMLVAVNWSAMLSAMALASWLTAQEVLSGAAIAAVGLISFWSVRCLSDLALQRQTGDPLQRDLAQQVVALPEPQDEDDLRDTAGLEVRGLSLKTGRGDALLSDISFKAPAGAVIGIAGGPGAGKSLLLQALCNPYDMAGLQVSGHVAFNGTALWARSAAEQAVPAVLLPVTPLLVPASGLQNLTCFQSGAVEERGRRILEQLVFAADAVDSICAAPDARNLSTTEQKALGFARAFAMAPGVYLMDRPEDGASEKLISAIARRIQMERRAGRSFLLVTQNRALLELCDKLLMLQGGRVVDYGAADEIRARQSSGWARFVGARALDTEDNLESWIRSHFRRDGDDANRRNACTVAAELLALSCQSSAPVSDQSVIFEFKHFEGYCLIKLIDQDVPLSTGQLQRARQEAEAAQPGSRLSPLANVTRACLSLEASVEMDRRVIVAQLETYDPRKNEADQHASQNA